MSRAGYIEDIDEWALIRWRGAVRSAIRGRRGQAFLRELRDGLDAMEDKRLIEGELVREDGCACAMGVVAKARGVDVSRVDEYDPRDVGATLGITRALAAEIAYINDEEWSSYVPMSVRVDDNLDRDQMRWKAVRAWVEQQIEGKEYR